MSPGPFRLSSRFWADLSTREFARLAASDVIERAVAVLPVAAIEQHGPHLPVSVDKVLLEGVIAASLPHLAEDLPVLFLPTQSVGKSNEHERFPGTLSLSAQTLIQLWMDLGASVVRTGLKKLLILNSHGGQVSVMDIVARDLRARYDLLTVHCSWFSLPQPEAVRGLFSAPEHRFGIHAGQIETAMMLALAPERVDMSQARHFDSASRHRAQRYEILGNGQSARLGWQMQDYNPEGAVGDAAAARSDQGEAVLAAAGEALARLLDEIARLPLSTLVDRPLDRA